MASNQEFSLWRVHVKRLPASITVEKLAEIFCINPSSICIPKSQKYETYHAWINGFKNKQEADKFLFRNRQLTISNIHVEFSIHETTEEVTESRQSWRGLPVSQSITQSTLTSHITNQITGNEWSSHQQYDLLQQPRDIAERTMSSVQLPTQTFNPEYEGQLCRYANKGTCRFKDGECQFRHTRCPNYNSCSQPNCLLAHPQQRYIPGRSVSQPCRNGINCVNSACRFAHPPGWSICANKEQCADYECTSNHPPNRQKKCPNGNQCNYRNCQFLHPKIPADECGWGTRCRKWDCPLTHPVGRTDLCSNGDHCRDNLCTSLHPRGHAHPSVSTENISTEVIALSGAQMNFLQFHGQNIVKTIRDKAGMTDVKVQDGQLQLTGKRSTVIPIKSYVRETLCEQHVTISSALKMYLENGSEGFLLMRFLEKYPVGISFGAMSRDTTVSANQTLVYGLRERERGKNDEHDHDSDGNSDISNRSSNLSVLSGHFQQRDVEAETSVQVSLCSDSKDLLSKGIAELQSYSLTNQSWTLTKGETTFILSYARQERYPTTSDTGIFKLTHRSPIADYLVDLVQSVCDSIVQINVNYQNGVCNVKVRGFAVYVNNAVEHIKSYLNDHVKTEVQLSISNAMSVYLRTKASSDIQKLEKTHQIKISNSSKAHRRSTDDQEVDDDHQYLTLIGPPSRIRTAQSNVEDFLESLCEEEKHFPCLNWDVSKTAGHILCKHLSELQKSCDCEAIGWIKSYTQAERRNTTAKLTLTIISSNRKTVEKMFEQCKNLIDGYTIWQPSTEEYRAIVYVLLKIKSPSIQEFQSQWDTKVELNRETGSVVIAARSRMLANEIKETLLNLGKEKGMNNNRFCEFLPVPQNIRHLVKRMIYSRLEEIREKRIFIDLEKSSDGLTINGPKQFVIELKPKIESIIEDAQRNIVSRCLQLSPVESDFMRANAHEVVRRIQRQTQTVIRDVNADMCHSSAMINDRNQSSILITVANSRDQSIVVEKGDITQAKDVDAIINAANGSLEHPGGVDKVIADAAGPLFDRECKELIRKNQGLPIPAGQAVKTIAGDLPFQCVIHAIGPQFIDGNRQERPLLFSSVFQSLQLAELEGLSSVALPAISSKTYSFPLGDCTNLVVRAVKQFFANYPQSKVRRIHLMDIDETICSSFAHEVALDHRNVPSESAIDMQQCQLPSLKAKWCWKNEDGERIYIDSDMRQIEDAFQQYLTTSVASSLTIGADNLRSGVIVHYQIHFRSDLQQFLENNPKALNSRLVCGYQMRVNTGYRREIIRYPLTIVEQEKPTKSVRPHTNPLDLYHSQTKARKEDWTITGLTEKAVEKCKHSIALAIQSEAVNESFSIHLNEDFDDHKRAVLQIAAQHHIEIDFTEEYSNCLSMTLKGFKASVCNAKVNISSYAQNILRTQVENDDELRIPKHWSKQEEGCQLIEILPDDPDFLRIVNRMKETMTNIKVKKIERVQNVRMWKHYAFRRRELRKELCLMPDLQIEMELFHGTGKALPSEVYNGECGFDMRFSREGLWGTGTYFARNASYSCGKYVHTLSNGKKQVFLAQVLTGDIYDCPANRDLRQPPKKNKQISNRRYDSISGDAGGSKVYVVYENRVAYPTYLITFTS